MRCYPRLKIQSQAKSVAFIYCLYTDVHFSRTNMFISCINVCASVFACLLYVLINPATSKMSVLVSMIVKSKMINIVLIFALFGNSNLFIIYLYIHIFIYI